MKVNKIGVEVEGEFFIYPGDVLESSENWEVKGDGSLTARNGGYCYELVSEALEYSELIEACKDLEGLEQDDSKRIAYANTTAGTHLHVSLADADAYDVVRSYSFYKAFMKAYDETFSLAKYRSRKGHRYCETIDRESDFIMVTGEQARATSRSDVRYKAINFCKAYHGTIEFRIFPYVVTVEGLIEIIKFVRDFIEGYSIEQSDVELLKKWTEHDFLVIPEKRNVTYELWRDIIANYTSAYQLQADNIQVSKEAISIDLLKMLAKTTIIKFENDK